jgi:hypothetical protein
MDFNCIEALLNLPEFRVTAQVLGPKQLDLHLERRAPCIVCPRCQTVCSRIKESRPRCIRDLPMLEPFGITRYYTDYWGAYTRHLDPEEHTPGKQNTQKIERKHLTLRGHASNA